MAGHYSENEISQAVRRGTLTGKGGAWDLIAQRVAAVPDYAARFVAVYPDVTAPDDIGFTDISNAIAAFMEFEWRSDTAPFDGLLAGEDSFSGAQARGLELFYGAAGCAACHSGPLLTDFDFHAMGQPQLGPGKAARFERHARDEGRFRVTGQDADRFAFRTPSLRNVALTGPWGHSGAFGDLARFVAAHADPRAALRSYDRSGVVLPEFAAADWRIMDDPSEVAAISAAVEVEPVTLDAQDVSDIMAFLHSLTDPAMAVGRLGVPKAVPSGLPVPSP
jgi:cytochrome c peroxidase